MPLISTLGSAGSQSFGTRGLQFGGSAFFNAASDYLVVPLSSSFTHTGNFTLEMWVYPTNLSAINLLWRQANFGYLWISPTGQIGWYHGSNPWSFSSATVLANNWNHLAVVRNSGVITLYVNGVGSGAVFNTNTISTTINPLIGSWDGTATYQFYGYLTNLRVARQALYTSNFTPITRPLTVNSQGSSNTVLLLNMKSASTVSTDSSASNFSVTNSSVTYSSFTPFNQPYVTPPTVVLQSATVTPTTFAPSEGTTITFNVVGTNTPNGTYYYTIEEDIATGAITASDFTSGSLSGTFTINGNTGSFPLTVRRDLLTEGTEEFVVYVRSNSTTGAILGTSGNIAITDSSLTPAFTVSPTSIDEGASGSFTVQNVGPDGTYFWTILNGTTANADFTATSGSFTVSGSTGGLDNGTGTFSVSTVADGTTEGSETFQVQVRSGSTSGTVVITSSSVTINDTSLTPSIFSGPGSISEGSTGTFQANNLGPAGTYYWTILHETTTAADFVANSGSFVTVSLNGTGSFDVSPVLDYTTEGSESFRVQVRSGSIAGPVLATSEVSTLVGDTSTTVTATPSPTTISEGSSTTISVSSTSLPTGTYYWTILNGTTTNADFTASSGSFSVFLNSGSFTVTAATLDGAEGAETFQVQIRTGSTSGTVIATTGTITINASVT